jgi:eukaryotic-like serine/threonine-protein kinase
VVSTDLQQQLQASLPSEILLERELGGGGMSRVFLARDTSLGRRVVVKVLNPDLGAELSTERFAREIRLAAQLQDPRIVPLLQAGHVGTLPFYTMPYIEGESLRTRLARAPLPLEEALGILRDVALALEYAHQRQVVHRDVKPENILLTGRTAVVADFGIAKAISASAREGAAGTLTALGSIVGTPAYMAPEQAAGDPVDARADLYAWGVIAYELLVGEHPFASCTTAQAVMAAHIAELPVPLAERRSDLPAALTTLVDRCLAKDAGRRPPDAAAVLAQLALPATPRGPDAAWATPRRLTVLASAIVLLAASGVWLYRRSAERRWAREDALPEVARLNTADRSLAAFLVLARAQRDLPADTAIGRVAAADTMMVSVTSSPPGATVAIQDYVTPDAPWLRLGTTPLTSVTIPKGYFRWRLSLAGARDYVAAPVADGAMRFALDSAAQAPDGMVRVVGGPFENFIDFLGWVGPYDLPTYYLDRYEVTNRQYQAFVDSGGYTRRRYWTQLFTRDGRTLRWEEAMVLFRDRTGRAGPSTWEAGHYPEGRGDYPVSGISWYEASAYAAFVGKSLPALAQWFRAAPPEIASYIVRASNIGRSSPAPVGAFHGVGPYGTYDMAGNVREWVANALGDDRRFILGGAWSSQTYLYSEPEALSPFDRSALNGFRCVRNVAPVPPAATRAARTLERDFTKARPASDAVFNAYRIMYAYDRTPLNARVEGVVEDTPDWREEKITFDAAYGNERVMAYLFLPKRVRSPYQTVVFFPSARVLDLTSSKTLGDVTFFDYVVQSGRAVLYPIYQDTYERRVKEVLPGASQDMTLTVERFKDLGRSLDYLQTRPDIDGRRLAYLGVSMGAAEGVIYATLAQDRFRTVVLLDGGFFLGPAPAGRDQVDFAPRLTKPVLMVNGRYDFSFSLEKAQLPLYRMLGTPPADKRHVVLPTPHDVRADRADLVREVLGWLDKYLGRVS